MAKLHGNDGGAAELACCARWRRRNENWSDEQVGQARGGVHIVASSARASAARVTHALDVF